MAGQRRLVQVLLAEEGVNQLDVLAQTEQVTRSDVIRCALRVMLGTRRELLVAEVRADLKRRTAL